MKTLKATIATLCAILGIVDPVWAGGSFDLDDIQPLLKDSGVWQEIEQKYQVAPAGDAIRFGNQWTELGAGRCGPYKLGAKLKGADGPFTHTVIVETYLIFLKEGKPITRNLEKEADDYTETLVKVSVVETGKDVAEKGTPEAVVRRYFEQVNERSEKEAYDCFSLGFQKLNPFKTYSAAFPNTREIQLFTAHTSDEGKDIATVTVRLITWNAEGVSSALAGPLTMTKGNDGWKIHDLSGLLEK